LASAAAVDEVLELVVVVVGTVGVGVEAVLVVVDVGVDDVDAVVVDDVVLLLDAGALASRTVHE